MKACPFCAEEIQDAAIVCKHCNRDLVSPGASPSVAPAQKVAAKSRGAWWGLVALGFLLVCVSSTRGAGTLCALIGGTMVISGSLPARVLGGIVIAALATALGTSIGSSTSTATTAVRSTAPAAAGIPALAIPAPPESSRWEIQSVESKVTETNDVWWRYAWKLTLTNKTEATLPFSGTIEFQDKDGFVVDESRTRGEIPAHGDETFTGFALVSMPAASRITKTNAKVSIR